MRKIYWFCLLVMGLFCISCASLNVTAKNTSVNTLSGDSYQAIELVEFSMLSGSRNIILAKTDRGQFNMYANVLTYDNNKIGSLILYVDGKKFNILDYPQNWDIDDVKLQSMGPRVNAWSGRNVVPNDVIEAIRIANTLTLKVVNGSLGLSYTDLDNVDLTKILPKIKSFLEG